MAKISIDQIKEELAKDNWTLISEQYKNLDTEMTFECSEGHRVYATWKKIRQNRECPICKKNSFKSVTTEIIPKKKGTIRILALDQSTRLSGWSIFDGGALTTYGVFETSFSDEIKRDNAIKNWLISMCQNWKPDYVGIEGIQFQAKSEGRVMGVTVFETLARLQGILMETCFELEIPYKVCPTNTWRAHCGVKGVSRSDKKKSMQLLVKKWYDVSVSNDEADAIGIGKYVTDTAGAALVVENWE